MQVKLFKLTTGQDIVAEYIKPTSLGHVIQNPLLAHVMKGADGTPTLAFAPWTMIAQEDQDMELLDQAIAAGPLEAVAEIAQSYEQQMSSIILPPAATGKILHG